MNSGHKNKLEKVDEILNLAFKIEAKLSYRDFYNVKK